MKVADLAMKIFGNIAFKYYTLFGDLGPYLKKANIKYTVEEWFAIFLFVSTFLVFPIVFLATFIIFFLFIVKDIFLSAIIALAISLLSIPITMMIFIMYPSAVMKARERKIENQMFFGTTYMSAIASGGIAPIRILELVAEFKELGEFAKEIKDVVDYVRGFGLSLPEALEKKAELTPSEKMRDLLLGLKTVILTGGDLTAYLMEKAKSYLNDYRRKLQEFTNDLGVYIEIYLTVAAAGSIFGIILLVIIALIAGSSILKISMPILVFMIPALSLGFIFMIRAISPVEK